MKHIVVSFFLCWTSLLWAQDLPKFSPRKPEGYTGAETTIQVKLSDKPVNWDDFTVTRASRRG